MEYNLDEYISRHSVRSYSAQPVEKKLLDTLRAKLTFINTHGVGMHLQMVTDDPAPFSAFKHSYGMFTGVRNYIACVVDTSYRNYLQRLGYHIMDWVMTAHRLGLGTCIVGATFDRQKTSATVKIGHVMPVVITFGYPQQKEESLAARVCRKMVHLKHSRAQEMLARDCSYEDCPAQVRDALTAMAHAPSAYNALPARLWYRTGEPPRMTLAKENKFALIDMGIAMFCVSDICNIEWEWGNPAVALE